MANKSHDVTLPSASDHDDLLEAIDLLSRTANDLSFLIDALRENVMGDGSHDRIEPEDINSVIWPEKTLH